MNVVSKLIKPYRFRRLKRILNPDHETVLDVGSDDGYFYRRLLFMNYNITCMDKYMSDEGKHNMVPGDIEDIPFGDDTFDTVLCLEVLEHVPDPVKAIKELRRVCKHDLIISVPYEPWFTIPKLGFWSPLHWWTIRPQVFKYYLGEPVHEELVFMRRYYMAKWKI